VRGLRIRASVPPGNSIPEVCSLALFYVTYDLIKYKDYPKLTERLGQYKAVRVLLSVWALKGNYTASGLRDDLRKYIDNDDRLLVIESVNWASWNLISDPNKL
jgi:hypothetical protein